jgi:hypothetical protein
MSWLPDIVTYVTPPSADGHVSLFIVLLTSTTISTGPTVLPWLGSSQG